MSAPGAAERRRLLKLLSALRPSPDRSKGLPETLTGAVSIGDLELVRVFLAHGADLEERTIGFASPLAAACASGRNVDRMKWLTPTRRGGIRCPTE